MPRTSSREHFDRYRLLRDLWLFTPSIYAVLSPTQQWEVHRLYRPSEFMTEEQLPSRMRDVLATEPSLVNRVGKHWHRLNAVYERATTRAGGPEDWEGIGRALSRSKVLGRAAVGGTSRRGKVIRVAPIMRPEPDYERLARGLLSYLEWVRNGKPGPGDWPSDDLLDRRRVASECPGNVGEVSARVVELVGAPPFRLRDRPAHHDARRLQMLGHRVAVEAMLLGDGVDAEAGAVISGQLLEQSGRHLPEGAGSGCTLAHGKFEDLSDPAAAQGLTKGRKGLRIVRKHFQ
ncbi:hypothetical protein ELQ90_12280 [Labedella phragmitis]|uniref:Uncharacterized protein n=1 Tax=Labedella phragmitis TaxID=2498849 RepID=A0A3S3Z658_9MICO|nr:hypothetical protein [Labedella phragmitis]RWZ49542.1 hypothetical protein ELQ90_12280 [Labedella phragmitis]